MRSTPTLPPPKIWNVHLNKDTSLTKKIWTLFREQGIMIAFILMAIGIIIGVQVEALLPGSGGVAGHGKDGADDKPENVKA